VISSHSEKPVANFNIVNLSKSAKEFFARQKKGRPGLNLQDINLKFAPIVAFYKA